MKKIFIALILVGFIAAKSQSGFDTLLSHLDFKLIIENHDNEKFTTIEFCPTEECVLFAFDGDDLERMTEFLDMYLLYFYDYGDLIGNPQDGNSAIEYLEFRLNEMGDVMIINQEEILANIHLLIQKLDIRKFYYKYFKEESIQIWGGDWEKREINEVKIKKNFEWYKRHGLISDFRLK